MPEKTLMQELRAFLTQPEFVAAWWAGIGGAMRALALKTSLRETAVCVFMGVVWGIVAHPLAGPIFDFLATPILGKLVGLPADAVARAVAVMVGMTGVAITGFIIDFFAAWRKQKVNGNDGS